MSIQRRRTKIIVTLGPSLNDRKSLEKVFAAGADVFRANFSHGSQEDHARRIQEIRDISKKAGREVAIFADLQGPKIRIARFKDKKVILKENSVFVLDVSLGDLDGDENSVGIDYKDLIKDVSSGDMLLLDDGRVVLRVTSVEHPKIICQVIVGGELSNNKGINKQGGGLSAPALTEKDKEDIKFAATLDVDYFAVSFPRDANALNEARALVRAAGSLAGIISKVERVEAVQNIDEIIKASDAVMVARGDLGVEIGDAELPAVQKRIIKRCRTLNKPVITATQMMESMIHNSIPTRAEVFDVANAVLDITDAVMLSAETASGDHPDVVVEAMSRVCLGAEKQPETQISKHRVECMFESIGESIAMAAMYTANHEQVKAIISLTESGGVPLLMSRIKSGIPIFGLTRNISAARRMNLYRGVYPMMFDVTSAPVAEVDNLAASLLKDHGVVRDGDIVIITKGDIVGVGGHTNSMKIHVVGEGA